LEFSKHGKGAADFKRKPTAVIEARAKATL
jgi:hypothetical protein